MTWRLQDIKEAYDRGAQMGATHMIVAFDDFDHDHYPIYVMPGEDPQERRPKNGDSVDECYKYSIGWTIQSMERRANHWEND